MPGDDYISCVLAQPMNSSASFECTDASISKFFQLTPDDEQDIYNVFTVNNTVSADGSSGNYSVQFLRPYSTGDDADFQITDGDNLNLAYGYGFTDADGVPTDPNAYQKPDGT